MKRSVFPAGRGGTPGCPGWVALALAATCLSPAGAATVGDKAASRSAEALEHYNQGRFSEAVDMYRQAQIEDPDSHDLLFNVGDGLYKQGDLEAAGRAFEETSSVPSLSARSYYNLGNTLFQKQEYPRAVEAYREAIIRGFEEEAGKANLELALRMQEQQQQQEQKQERGEQPESSPESERGREGESSGQGQEQDFRQEESREESGQPPGQEQPMQSPQPPEEKGQPEGEQPIPGQMQPEEAEQLLDAFADSEQEAQRRRFRVEARAQVKDW